MTSRRWRCRHWRIGSCCGPKSGFHGCVPADVVEEILKAGTDSEGDRIVIRAPTPLAFALATVLAWMLFLGVLVGSSGAVHRRHPAGVRLAGSRYPTGDRSTSNCAKKFQLPDSPKATGAVVTVTVVVGGASLPMIEVVAVLPPLIEVADGNNRVVLAVQPGRETEMEFYCRMPGARPISIWASPSSDVWDRSGLSVCEGTARLGSYLGLSRPSSMHPACSTADCERRFSFGNYVSSRVGDGIEPGEIRPFMPGDRIRHINWRASLRRQQLYVTQYHEERNADIVLLLDTLSDTGAPPCSTVDYPSAPPRR